MLKTISKHAFFKNIDTEEPYAVENIDFSNNALESLPENLLRWTKIKELNLNGNLWNCDCKMSWLVNTKLELDGYLLCSSPKRLADKPIRDLIPSDFVCQGKNIEKISLKNMSNHI